MASVLSLPFREILPLMKETYYLHLISGHVVEEPVRANDQLSQSRIPYLWHHPTTFTQFRSAAT